LGMGLRIDKKVGVGKLKAW